MQTKRQLRRAAGFTLLEAAFTIIIIGTGALAILAAQQAFHRENVQDAPPVLFDVLKAQRERLLAAQKSFGDYVAPESFA